MTRSRLLKTIVLLTLATHASCQLIDLFQSFNAFLQPYQNNKQNGGTRKQASKPVNRRIDDLYFQNGGQNSRIIDPFGIYTTTTVKPRKNRVKTTTKSWFESSTEPPKKKPNLINTNIHFLENRNINSGSNGNRRTDNDNRKVVNTNNEYNTNNYGQNSRKTTTTKPAIDNDYFNRYTTTNPLLNRPGVRPAVVDDNRPPITNRPVTKRPIYFPTEPTKRPTYTQQTTKKPNLRPVTNGPFQGAGPDFTEEEPEIEIGPDEDDMSEAEKRRYLQVAEQKCDEYKSMRVKKVVALPLAPSGHGVEVNVSTCRPSNIPLIIGGKVVSINEFPHMGLVGWKRVQKDGYSWKCGGSLISEQYVLTAGHCTYQDKDYNVISGPPHAVQLGSSYLDDKSAQVIHVSAVVRHAKYKLRRSYYDVALIRLATVVSFSEVISPACLGIPPSEGEPVIATGWGKTEFGGESSYELRSVSIPIWNMEDCREIWGTSRKLPNGPSPDSQLCAGQKQGGKDTCQGDSGGPAQVQDGCVWRVVAVTSVGRSCGAPDTPALYARIPRAFIASQAFANIKVNNNGDNWNNNRDNDNNNRFNANTGNNNRDTVNNNQNSGSSNGYNVNSNGYNVNSNGFNVNNQYNGDNNRGTGSNNGYNVNNSPNNGYNVNDKINYHTDGVINLASNVNNNQNNANNNRYNVNNNVNDNRNYNTNPLDTTVNVNRNQNTYNNDNIYSTPNLNNNQPNTNNRNQNTYNDNNNKKDNNIITQPAVQTYYNDNQYSSTPVNYNNNWSNYDNNNSPNVNNYGSNNNRYNTDYNSYTTHNYNDYNRNNNYDGIINTYTHNNRRPSDVNLNNNGFPIVANTPWWNR